MRPGPVGSSFVIGTVAITGHQPVIVDHILPGIAATITAVARDGISRPGAARGDPTGDWRGGPRSAWPRR